MALIEVEGLHRSFTVRRRAGRLRRTSRRGARRAGPVLRRSSRRDGRLHRAQRRREVDDHQDAHRHPGARPSGGSGSPGSTRPQRVELARRIGVVFGQRTTLWWDLPLRDSFDLLRQIYRVAPDRHRRNLEEFTELLDLGDLLDTPVRQLSLGQRMRGDIAAALLHDPEILYLDEPTIGLDVVSKGRLREFLRRVNARARASRCC